MLRAAIPEALARTATPPVPIGGPRE
jgi:hypothetical protein